MQLRFWAVLWVCVSCSDDPEASTPLPPTIETDDAMAGEVDAAAIPDATPEPAFGGALRFSEVAIGSAIGGWFEVRNVSDKPVALDTFRLAVLPAPIRLFNGDASPEEGADGGDGGDAGNTGLSPFLALPAITVAPGAYVIVRILSETYTEAPERGRGPEHVTLRSNRFRPYQWNDTVVSLVDAQGSESDTLQFGQPKAKAENAKSWVGTSLTHKVNATLARSGDGRDSNQRGDWVEVAYETPAAPNDVNDCKTDADADGIPDCAEAMGRTYAGEDYYAYGARPGRVDIFVEIDQMAVVDDPMNILQKEAIASVQRLFAKKNIAFHADYGSRYHPASGVSAADWDLGQGNDAIAFEESIEFAKIRAYKAQYMRPRRWNAFHYVVLAKAETDASLYGRGEINGNDLMLYYGTYKRLNFAYGTQEEKNVIANMQAHTFAHELGHNLGLRHGGDEDASEKPNYVSEMSYLWRTWPPPGSEAAWYNYRRCKIGSYPAANSPRLPPMQFELNFSEGMRADVDEASLSDGFVDYNCNGSSEQNYSFDANEDGQIGILKDHNDWAKMKFAFYPFATRVVTGPSFAPSNGPAVQVRGCVIDDVVEAME